MSDLLLTEQATGLQPAAGKHSVYVKPDGKIYKKNSAGEETLLSFDPHSASASKAALVEADEFPLSDSEASFLLKRTTFANIRDALNGRLVKNVAGAADVTLTTSEASNLFIELTGTLTGNINVVVPASVRAYHIYNATTGGFTITVKTAAGAGVPVGPGYQLWLECNGTNVVRTMPLLKTNGLTEAAGGSLSINGSVALNGAVPQSGTGITFPATQSASSNANTLDDYEEGNWTPTAYGQASAGSTTHSIQQGSYLKVGGLVTVSFALRWTAATGTGDMRIGGLPFTNKTVNGAGGFILNSGSVVVADGKVASIPESQSAAYVYMALSTTGDYFATFSYFAD